MERNKESFKEIRKYIDFKMKLKYRTNKDTKNIILINNIIFNEKCHLVAIYKDFLIYEEEYEFIKRFYNKKETLERLTLYSEFYEKYSIIYPNYIILPESKYIYRNLNKKQKIIDNQESSKKEKSGKKKSIK